MANQDRLFSNMVRSGKTTYFVDVRKSKNGKKYLLISESKFSGENKRERKSIAVFPNAAGQLRDALSSAVDVLEG
ncbi:MAG: DUF3276 family protein [Bacteroidota bacterium]